jgi:hypothetical protein
VVSYSGSCKELIREYIHSKPHLVISEENHMDNASSTSPINQVADEPITDAPEVIVNASSVEEIEQICSVVNAPPPTILTHSIDTEPIIEGTYKSPVRGDVATPTSVSETVEIPYGATSPRAPMHQKLEPQAQIKIPYFITMTFQILIN